MWLRFSEELSRHTGLSDNEINKDLAMKKKIIEYMVKNNIRSLEQVGKVFNNYYLDPGFVTEIVDKNRNKEKLLGE